MGKYQGYEKYKDSGVEWLGEIPEHWEVKRIKFIGNIKYGLGEPPEKLDDGLPIIRATDIYRGIIDGSKVQRVNPDKVPWSRNPELKAGDILVVRSGAYTGDSAIVPNEWAGAIAGYDMVLTPTKAYSKYIALNLLSKHILEGQIYLAKSRAAQPHLNAEELGNTILAIPPLPEQKTIAQFLDHKTKQIDELIAKKEALLEKLDEKRTALISHAVTKGLDPNVPMKDSGIEWLGEIPKHWEVIKVKYLTKILRGKFTHRPRNDPKLYDGQYPFIQTGDVANANKFIMEYTQTLNENGYAVSKEFPSGTLVMTIAANIGDMAILNFNACFPDSIVGFVPSENTELFFLYYLLSSMKKQFLSTAVLNTQLNLNVERISNIFTVIPPLDEQIKINKILDKEMQEIDQQKAKINEAIELLKEYRTALITNAVTGKIDVRQVPIP